MSQGYRHPFPSSSPKRSSSCLGELPTTAASLFQHFTCKSVAAEGAGSCRDDKAVLFPSGCSPSVRYIHLEEMLPEGTHLLQTVYQERRHPFSAQGMCTGVPSTLRISRAFPLLSSPVPALGGHKGPCREHDALPPSTGALPFLPAPRYHKCRLT